MERLGGDLLVICEMYTFYFWFTRWDLQFQTGSEWIWIVDNFFMANLTIVSPLLVKLTVVKRNIRWYEWRLKKQNINRLMGSISVRNQLDVAFIETTQQTGIIEYEFK